MAKIQLSQIQVLEFIILGIKNGQYQAAINLAQDCIAKLDAQSKTNQPLDHEVATPKISYVVTGHGK